MPTHNVFHRLLLSAAVLLALLATSTLQPAQARDDAPPAYLRLVHASPDAPPVDVYLNGELFQADIAFFTAGPHTPLPSDDYQIQVTPAGGSLAEALLDRMLELTRGQTYSFVLTGSVASLEVLVFEDNLAAPSDSDETRLDVFHLAPGTGPVDVKLGTGETLFPALSYGTASDIELLGNIYTLAVTPADQGETALTIVQGADLRPRGVYHLFLIGFPDGFTAQFLLAGGNPQLPPTPAPDNPDQPGEPGSEPPDSPPVTLPPPDPDALQNTRLRVAYAVPDGPPVDIYLDGALAFPGLAFFALGPYVTIPGDIYRVQVVPAGAPSNEVIFSAEVALSRGNGYTLAITGVMSGLSSQLFENDLTGVEDDDTRVTVYHLVPDSDAFDVKRADGLMLFEELAFGEQATREISPREYTILVTPHEADSPVLTNDTVTFPGASINDYFIINTLDRIETRLSTNGAVIVPTP